VYFTFLTTTSFETFFTPISIWRVWPNFHTEKHLGFHVKCPLSLSNFNNILIWRYILVNIFSIKLHGNLFSASRIVTCEYADRRRTGMAKRIGVQLINLCVSNVPLKLYVASNSVFWQRKIASTSLYPLNEMGLGWRKMTMENVEQEPIQDDSRQLSQSFRVSSYH
jgi:hypothetical protein